MEMKSFAEWDQEQKEKQKGNEEKIKRRTEKIQRAIDEKGLARFMAELKISSWSHDIII